MPSNFFWYDVMTTDVPAAQNFYGDVIGWGAEPAGANGYTLFTLDGRGVAGLMTVPKDAAGARPAWIGYIGVDDVDAKVVEIEKAGGTIHKPPFEVPGTIRMAVVADPQGSVFLVAKGLVEDPPPDLPLGTPGTAGWRELYATDWRAAFAFYEKLFGWTKGDAIDMGPMGTYQLFNCGEVTIGGMMDKPPMIPVSSWLYYFNVPALDAAIARAKTGGGTVTHGPIEVPGGQWIAQCIDPQGAAFAIVANGR